MSDELIKQKDIDSIVKSIEGVYGSKKSVTMQNKAINRGAERYSAALKSEAKKYKRTGLFSEDIIVKKARKVSGKNFRSSAIGWDSSHGRHRLAHLLQWGYDWRGIKTKHVKPKSYGFISKVNKQFEKEYVAIVKEELMK